LPADATKGTYGRNLGLRQRSCRTQETGERSDKRHPTERIQNPHRVPTSTRAGKDYSRSDLDVIEPDVAASRSVN
jgi:hypothetical protein